MNYRLYLTTQGREKVAAAASSARPLALTEFVVGSGKNVDFSTRLSENNLVKKHYQGRIQAISKSTTHLGQYEIDCVIPEGIGGFVVREFGLLDESGVLVYVGALPEVEKPKKGSAAALDYRIKAVVEIDNPDVSLMIDGFVVTATRDWTERHFVPKSALELIFPIGYKYWSHSNDSPEAGFDALFGYKTYWRRLSGVHLLAVSETDSQINAPMRYVGGIGDVVTDGTPPEVYTGYTSYLWERYEPKDTPVRYDGQHQYDTDTHYQ